MGVKFVYALVQLKKREVKRVTHYIRGNFALSRRSTYLISIHKRTSNIFSKQARLF